MIGVFLIYIKNYVIIIIENQKGIDKYEIMASRFNT